MEQQNRNAASETNARDHGANSVRGAHDVRGWQCGDLGERLAVERRAVVDVSRSKEVVREHSDRKTLVRQAVERGDSTAGLFQQLVVPAAERYVAFQTMKLAGTDGEENCCNM